VWHAGGIANQNNAHMSEGKSEMTVATVGVDLAKNVFQLVEADDQYRVCGRRRLSRTQFSRWMGAHPRCHVVLEACGTSHHWARVLEGFGHRVSLLPAQHVRAYVRRNKTDAADAAALVEASRSGEIRPVSVKTIAQQVLQQLHRLRTQWLGARTARINSLRGMLREFGIDISQGVVRGLAQIRETLEVADNGLPEALRPFINAVLTEIAALDARVAEVDRSLKALTRNDPVVARLAQVPGVGPMFATAVCAAINDIHRFPSGRHLAAWLGLTAREHSSGEKRRLGKISKEGDVYLRTLLIHGARSVLTWAKHAEVRGHRLDRLRRWALEMQQRVGHNKATVALANKLARVVWATWKYERTFDGHWGEAVMLPGHNQ